MSAPEKQEYKFKKGDDLDDIAKKHGLKDGNAIWKFADNKAIAGKRGKPDQLQAGDVLVIPPSEKDLKKAHDALQESLNSVEAEIGRSTQKIAKIDKLIADTNTFYLGLVKDLTDNRGKVKSMGGAADAAAMLASMAASFASIARNGVKGATATAKELEDLNKDMLHDAKHMIGDPMLTGAAKVMATGATSTNTAILFIGVLGDSFDKMTSPSFWGSTITQLLAGKSWSEAVTTDITDELDEHIREIQAQRNAQIKTLFEHKKRIEPIIGLLQAQEKTLQAKLKELH